MRPTSIRPLLAAALLVGAGACHRQTEPAPGSDGCHYKDFKGFCKMTLVSTGVPDPTGGAVVSVSYQLTSGDAPGLIPAQWKVAGPSVTAFLKYLRQNPVINCEGQLLLKGACTPGEVRLGLDAFPGAERR
jgi:hypothetical protein